MIRTLFVLAGLQLAFVGVSPGQQDAPRLDAGQRVRVHEGKRAVVGTLLSVDSAAVRVLTSHTDTAHLRRADITGVDVSVGKKSRVASGALIGAGGGYRRRWFDRLYPGRHSWTPSGDESLVYVAAAALGVYVLGAGVGAVVGAGSHTDRWAPAVWPAVGLGTEGVEVLGVGIGMRIRF